MSSVLLQLRVERDETILEVSRTANILKDIEQQMEEANRYVYVEKKTRTKISHKNVNRSFNKFRMS